MNRRLRSSNVSDTHTSICTTTECLSLIRKRNKEPINLYNSHPMGDHELLPRSLKLQRLLKNTIARCIFHSSAGGCCPPPSSRLPLAFCSCSFCALASASANGTLTHRDTRLNLVEVIKPNKLRVYRQKQDSHSCAENSFVEKWFPLFSSD